MSRSACRRSNGPSMPRTACTSSRCSRIWLHLPFTFIILYAARLAIPTGALRGGAHRRRHRAGRPSGTSRSPLLVPAMLIAMLFRYIFAFRLFSEVWLLTQGGPARSTEVVAVYLYLEAFRYNAFGAASATGWIMVATRSCWRRSICASSTGTCSAMPLDAPPHAAGPRRRPRQGRNRGLVLGWSIGPDRLHRHGLAEAGARTSSPCRRGPVASDARALRASCGRAGAIFSRALKNSLIVTAGATLLAVAVSTLAGLRLFPLAQPPPLRLRLLAMIALRLLPPIVIDAAAVSDRELCSGSTTPTLC